MTTKYISKMTVKTIMKMMALLSKLKSYRKHTPTHPVAHMHTKMQVLIDRNLMEDYITLLRFVD